MQVKSWGHLQLMQQGQWLTWHRSAWTEVSWFVFICILSIACFRTTTPLKGCQRRKKNILCYSAAAFLRHPNTVEVVQACSSLWNALKNLDQEKREKKTCYGWMPKLGEVKEMGWLILVGQCWKIRLKCTKFTITEGSRIQYLKRFHPLTRYTVKTLPCVL